MQLITSSTLVSGLAEIGICEGASLMVHCSMSSLGHVQGGAQTVVEALIQSVGEQGTLVMPTLTHGRFDPSEWRNPPVPEESWNRIRFETLLFDPQKTPTDHTMSAVYELFRTWPKVVRTSHPHSSIAAWGKHRNEIVQTHLLEDRFGDASPLGRLYEIDAQVLFIGTTYSTNTCFHLAEYRRPNPRLREFMIVRELSGERRLVRYTDVDTDSSVFEEIGTDFEASNPVSKAQIGSATCRLFSFCGAVDFAQVWLTSKETSQGE